MRRSSSRAGRSRTRRGSPSPIGRRPPRGPPTRAADDLERCRRDEPRDRPGERPAREGPSQRRQPLAAAGRQSRFAATPAATSSRFHFAAITSIARPAGRRCAASAAARSDRLPSPRSTCGGCRASRTRRSSIWRAPSGRVRSRRLLSRSTSFPWQHPWQHRSRFRGSSRHG